MHVGSAEVGGLVEVVEHDAGPRHGVDVASSASTSAAAGGCASAARDGASRASSCGCPTASRARALLGWIAEHVAAPTVRGHLRRSLQQLKRQVEHEQLRTAAARRARAAARRVKGA